MKPLHQRIFSGRMVKAALPLLSRVAMTRMAGEAIRYLELSACLIQGKGTGTGWELSSETVAATRFIRTKTPVLFDVGANFGHWSKLMLESFPECARLIMIEPQPECLSVLEAEAPAWTIIPCAVSNQPGNMTLFAGNKVGSGGASLFERHDSYFADMTLRQFTVRVMTLDDIIQQNNISTIDFMKMDIESAELLALKGATKALERNMIKALSFEFGSGNVNSRTFFRDFWELLHPLGFMFYRILPGGRLWCIDQYYEDLEYFRGDTNYIASRINPV